MEKPLRSMTRRRILFLCTGNSCRSQMAQVLMNEMGQGRFDAYSAGSKPAGAVHPLALKTLAEARLPTSGLRSKSWEEFAGEPFDFVITVCDRAKESCPVWPGQPLTAHWGFEDPADATGTEEDQRRFFRKVFSDLQTRIQMFLALPIDALSPVELKARVRALGDPPKRSHP